jgi:Na+/melibiose symporter-like transporter
MAYMLVRVAVNVTMTVQPFYLLYVTGFEKTLDNPTPISLAIVPLLSFLTSMLFSIFLYKRIMQRFANRQKVLLVAILIISLGSIPFIFLTDNKDTRWLVYVISPVQGIGMAMMLNTATSCISDVIGKSDQNSAFVYGAYGFFDKVANGVSLFFITAYLNTDPTALRWIIGLTPPVCSVGAFLACYYG